MEGRRAIPQLLHLAQDHQKAPVVVHIYPDTLYQRLCDPTHGGRGPEMLWKRKRRIYCC